MPALRELTVAVAAGARVTRSLAPVATLAAADPAQLAGADLLLVAADVAGSGAALAAEAARLGVPSAAWLRDPAGALDVPAEVLRGYDAVFVTDPTLAGPLEERTGRRPAPLPEAASSDALAAVRAPDPEPWLAVVPGAPDDRGFARLLAAAEGWETRELPADPIDVAAMLSRCAALLATHAAGASQLHLPGAVFDAVAMRTPVVVPTNRGAGLLLTGIVPRAGGPKQAVALVAEAVAQGAGPAAGAAAVRHAHTHAQRLATVASVLGLRVLPPAV